MTHHVARILLHTKHMLRAPPTSPSITLSLLHEFLTGSYSGHSISGITKILVRFWDGDGIHKLH